MNNALKKINARVKVLQKKHPKSKRTSLMKQAGKEYRAGKLAGKKRKKAAAPKKRKVTTRKIGTAKRRKAVGKKKSYTLKEKKKYVRIDRKGRKHPLKAVVVIGAAPKKRGRKRSYKPVRVTHCARVGKKKSHLGQILLVGGGLALLYLMTRKTTTTLPAGTALVNTGNIARNQAASQIVNYATAAGATVNAITNLVSALNSSSDNQVLSYASTLQATNQLPAALPDISSDVQAPSTSQAINFGI